jgi:3-methyladenine DNA glycosylase Tag
MIANRRASDRFISPDIGTTRILKARQKISATRQNATARCEVSRDDEDAARPERVRRRFTTMLVS